MKIQFKFYIAFILLVFISIAGGLAFAQPADSHLAYLPLLHNPEVVRLDASDIYVGRYLNWYVVGKLTNVSGQTVYEINLTAEIFLNNETMGVITGTTALPSTFPSDTNLFELYPTGIDYVDGLSVDVNVNSWSFEHDPEYLPLTILSKNFSGGGELGYLTGEIRNDNLVPVTSIEMLVYPGTEFSQYATSDKTSLAPGETSGYSATIYFPGFSTSDSFTVWAQGAIAK